MQTEVLFGIFDDINTAYMAANKNVSLVKKQFTSKQDMQDYVNSGSYVKEGGLCFGYEFTKFDPDLSIFEF